MRILVYTVFKVGSSSVTRMFHEYFTKTRHQPCRFYSGLDHYLEDISMRYQTKHHVVVKDHSGTLSKLSLEVRNSLRNHFDIIVTLIRDPYEIYPSAFFQNWLSEKYVYGDPSLVSFTMDQLLDHFQKFDWSSFPWLNYDILFQELHSLGHPSLSPTFVWDQPFDTCRGFQKYQLTKTTVLHVYRMDCLPKILSLKRKDNVSYDKSYGNLYKEFCCQLQSCSWYSPKYQKEHTKIKRHFFQE